MENQLEVIETDSRLTWKDRLNSMEISNTMNVGWKSAASVRMAIWKLQKTSEKRFETKLEDLILTVTRLEDELV